MNKLRQLWQLAFGDAEPVIDAFFDTAWSPGRCRYLTEGQDVTAALYWLDGELAGEKYAYIYGVATHPDYRGRGLCRQLMELTREQLAREGYAGALLMPADPGLRRMYAGMGYRDCGGLREFSCEAAGEAAEVRTVGPEEYAALRRKYLPERGLIQEKENLAYLTTYAQLYAGEDFLLMAVHEKDALFGMELLGNAHRAPGILKAMGYEKGTFRTPGREKAFGMYLALREDAPEPDYLGLAFD